jgi:hypothetical protein
MSACVGCERLKRGSDASRRHDRFQRNAGKANVFSRVESFPEPAKSRHGPAKLPDRRCGRSWRPAESGDRGCMPPVAKSRLPRVCEANGRRASTAGAIVAADLGNEYAPCTKPVYGVGSPSEPRGGRRTGLVAAMEMHQETATTVRSKCFPDKRFGDGFPAVPAHALRKPQLFHNLRGFAMPDAAPGAG